MKRPTVIEPFQCHLYNLPISKEDTKRNNFNVIKDFKSRPQLDTHECIRSLLQCRNCGQLYFHEYLEWTEQESGNDSQYETFIPVADEVGAEQLDKLSPLQLTGLLPQLRVSWPSHESETMQWVGRKL